MNILGQNSIGTLKSCSCFPLLTDNELTRHVCFTVGGGSTQKTHHQSPLERQIEKCNDFLNHFPQCQEVHDECAIIKNQGTSKGG